MTAGGWLTGERRTAAVLRHLSDAVVVIDAAATILWASDSAEELIGWTREDAVGMNGFDLIDPRDREGAATSLVTTLSAPGVKEPLRMRVVGPDGRSRWVEIVATNMLDDPDVEAVLISTRSLDEIRAAEASQRSAEELFRRAFDDAPVGMALVSPEGRLTRVNRALCDLVGYEANELLAMDATVNTHPDDVALELEIVRSLERGEVRSAQYEKRYVRPDGSVVWGSVGASLVRGPDGEPECYVAHVQDISARKASEEVLAHRATHDALTGLPNRALLLDRLRVALARAERLPTSVAVLFCDLDGFKGVNDRYGHAAGDEALVQVARRLEDSARPGDTVARWGGDELVVLCEDLSSEKELDAIADRMARAVRRPIAVPGGDVQLGLSVGVALSSGVESPDGLLRLADSAMYAAKAHR